MLLLAFFGSQNYVEGKDCRKELCFSFQKRINLRSAFYTIIDGDIGYLYGDGSYEIGTTYFGLSRTTHHLFLPGEKKYQERSSISEATRKKLNSDEKRLEYNGFYVKILPSTDFGYATLFYEKLTHISTKDWVLVDQGFSSRYEFSDTNINDFSGEQIGISINTSNKILIPPYTKGLEFDTIDSIISSVGIGIYKYRYNVVEPNVENSVKSYEDSSSVYFYQSIGFVF